MSPLSGNERATANGEPQAAARRAAASGDRTGRSSRSINGSKIHPGAIPGNLVRNDFWR
jgi:hypothetical protein